MLRHILASLISPLIGLKSCLAYSILIGWLETYVIRPGLSLPMAEDDMPYGAGLALFLVAGLFAAYFLAGIIGLPSILFLIRIKRDNFKYFVLTGLLVGTLLGMGLGMLIMASGDPIWFWLYITSLSVAGTLGAYVSYWLIAIQSRRLF